MLRENLFKRDATGIIPTPKRVSLELHLQDFQIPGNRLYRTRFALAGQSARLIPAKSKHENCLSLSFIVFHCLSLSFTVLFGRNGGDPHRSFTEIPTGNHDKCHKIDAALITRRNQAWAPN